MMFRPATCGLGIGIALAVAATAHADFLRVEIERVPCDACLQTYELYAVFDDPDDRLLAVGSGAGDGPLIFSASHPLWNDGGAFDGLQQEDFAGAPFTGPCDSFVTIGHEAFEGNNTGFTSGFLGGDGTHRVIEGDAWSETAGGWIDTFAFTEPFGERVLMARFTFDVPDGETLAFTLSGVVTWGPAETEGIVLSPFAVELGAPCAPDLDLDGVVAFPDLLVMLGSWGACPPDTCCPGDLDGDETIGFADLLELLAQWGDC